MQGNRLEVARALKGVHETRWDDTHPVARAHMREERHHRVRLEGRCAPLSILPEYPVDDATALRVRRQQAERQLAGVAPRDASQLTEVAACSYEQHVLLLV